MIARLIVLLVVSSVAAIAGPSLPPPTSISNAGGEIKVDAAGAPVLTPAAGQGTTLNGTGVYFAAPVDLPTNASPVVSGSGHAKFNFDGSAVGISFNAGSFTPIVLNGSSPTFAGVSFSGNATPTTDNAVPLGGPSNRWANIYSVLGTFGSSVQVGTAPTSPNGELHYRLPSTYGGTGGSGLGGSSNRPALYYNGNPVLRLGSSGANDIGVAGGIGFGINSAPILTGNATQVTVGGDLSTAANGRLNVGGTAAISADTGGTSVPALSVTGSSSNTAAIGLVVSAATSGGTGYIADFKTKAGTSALKINSNLSVVMGGAVTVAGTIAATPATRSGPGAVSVTTAACNLVTTGVADALTLADGAADGQKLTIRHVTDGGSGVLTPAHARGWSSATITNAGDTLALEWTSTSPTGWVVVGSYGTVVTP